jgi:hypothetical protein
VVGCGRGRGDLQGTVTFQNKPVRFGSVQVLGSDGITKAGSINDDGTYVVEDILAGPIKIAVHSPDPGQIHVATRKGEPPPKADRSKWFRLPDKFADFDKSELTFSLRAGPNTFDIPLK